MKQFKKVTSAFVLAVLIFAFFAPVLSLCTYSDDSEGFTTSTTERIKYTTQSVPEIIPRTFEATVKLPQDYSAASTLISNYVDVTVSSFSLSINAKGNPYVSIRDSSKLSQAVYTVTFSEVDLRTANWEHISITIDEENAVALCYVNGELKSTKESNLPLNVETPYPLVIGGSYSANSFFKGAIADIALYSDKRSAEEVLNDYTNFTCGDGLICYYDFKEFDKSSPQSTFPDLSGMNNDLVLFPEFYDEPVIPLDDYAYSFAVVGDIQIVNYYNPENLHCIYDWIIKNKDDKKIAFTINLGDITDKNTSEEWLLASEVLHTLDGKVPYSVVRGNHDKSIESYNEAFKYEDYKDSLLDSLDQNMLNTCQTFEISGNKYLILNIDYITTYDSVLWMHNILKKYHDHNVIVTTHIYLATDGKPLDKSDSLSPKKYGALYDSDKLWDFVLSKYENIMMIISGHISSSTILTTQLTGVNGNTVTQMLVNTQAWDGDLRDAGSLGMVAMLYFSEDGKSVQTQFYSTIQEKYFLTPNEYKITLDPIQSSGDPEPPFNHTFKAQSDENSHWEECACGEIQNLSEHIFEEWTVIKEADETSLGERIGKCACGYEKTEQFEYEEPTHIGLVLVICVSCAVVLGVVCCSLIFFIRKKQRKNPSNNIEN